MKKFIMVLGALLLLSGCVYEMDCLSGYALAASMEGHTSWEQIEEMHEIDNFIETVEFSYDDLMAVFYALRDMEDAIFHDPRSSVSGWGLGGNNITVYLHPYNEAEIARFMAEFIDSPMILFEPMFRDEYLQIRVQNLTDAFNAAEDRLTVVGEPRISRTGMVFELKNQADRDFRHGLQFDMAVYHDGEWLPVDFAPGYSGFWILPGFILQSGGTKIYHEEWNRMFGELPPGRYMFIRGGHLQGDNPREDGIYKLVEFTITEDCPVYLEE